MECIGSIGMDTDCERWSRTVEVNNPIVRPSELCSAALTDVLRLIIQSLFNQFLLNSTQISRVLLGFLRSSGPVVLALSTSSTDLSGQ